MHLRVNKTLLCFETLLKGINKLAINQKETIVLRLFNTLIKHKHLCKFTFICHFFLLSLSVKL